MALPGPKQEIQPYEDVRPTTGRRTDRLVPSGRSTTQRSDPWEDSFYHPPFRSHQPPARPRLNSARRREPVKLDDITARECSESGRFPIVIERSFQKATILGRPAPADEGIFSTVMPALEITGPSWDGDPFLWENQPAFAAAPERGVRGLLAVESAPAGYSTSSVRGGGRQRLQLVERLRGR